MADAGRYVFRASRDAHTQITRLFDFVHPTAIAMWNLRWQIQGFIANVPTASSADLDSRFALGTNLSAGSLRRAAIETSWDIQLEQFASIILINTIAIFEDFTASVAAVRFTDTKSQRRLAEALQFPSSASNGGWTYAMTLVGSKSQILDGAIKWDKPILRRFVPGGIDDLLKCYRYFKEIRNAIAHNGGRANERTKTSYDSFKAAIKDGRIGGAPIPHHSIVSAIGDPVKITYRGVVGFSDIVLRIIATYEIDLCSFAIVEQELQSRIQPDNRFWPGDVRKKDRRLKKLLQTNDFPVVTITPKLRAFLQAKGLVPSYAAYA